MERAWNSWQKDTEIYSAMDKTSFWFLLKWFHQLMAENILLLLTELLCEVQNVFLPFPGRRAHWSRVADMYMIQVVTPVFCFVLSFLQRVKYDKTQTKPISCNQVSIYLTCKPWSPLNITDLRFPASEPELRKWWVNCIKCIIMTVFFYLNCNISSCPIFNCFPRANIIGTVFMKLDLLTMLVGRVPSAKILCWMSLNTDRSPKIGEISFIRSQWQTNFSTESIISWLDSREWLKLGEDGDRMLCDIVCT